MKLTIYDVAEKAGVSISTVSKVLNNTGSLADKTRKKVKETMEELNYQPSVAASVKKRIQMIGLLIPNIANPFMAEVARRKQRVVLSLTALIRTQLEQGQSG
jgi:DNA-binding LacI/PurR family transcriptional regulator